MTGKRTEAKPDEPARSRPISLAPLSFEEAVKALATTRPMPGDKPNRQPKPRAAKKPKRKKTA